MNKKKHIITMVGVIIVIAGGMFYIGMKYGITKNNADRLAQRGVASGARMNIGVAGSGRGQKGPGGITQGGGNAGDIIAGDIIAKDDKSTTIKMRDGGSKIVYFSDTTTVGKTIDGTIADISMGESVMVNGKVNPDGSLVAQNIQIRPAQPKN